MLLPEHVYKGLNEMFKPKSQMHISVLSLHISVCHGT